MFLCIWRRVSCTTFLLHIFKPYSRLTKFFYQQTFNTILRLTGTYNMSLKATKSKQQCMNGKKLNSHKTVKY